MKRLISRSAIQAFALLFLLLLLTKSSAATTAILLKDDDLIASSRVIILGEIRSVKAQWDLNHQNIHTYVKVQVSNILKGQLQNDTIVFKQLGGTVGEESTVIFGTPELRADQRVLLFLDTAGDGTLRIAHLFQGKYDVLTDERSGELRGERKIDNVNLLGATEGPNITNAATLDQFTSKINTVLRDRAADVSYYDSRFEGVPIVETPPEYADEPGDKSHTGGIGLLYTFLGSFRWFQPDTGQPVTYRVNPNASPRPNGGTVEINQALAAWTNVQTTALVLQNIGSTTASGFLQDGVTAISYDDPLDQMSDPVGCSGTLAIGGVTSAGGSTIVIGGITFSRIFEGDVVFNRNFQCFLGISANLAEVATHEIGHSIGFGHSADAAAIMYATAHGNGRGATLGSDDIAAVSFLYPGSHAGQPPPAAPGSLTATAASSSAINLTWADNSNNEDGFRLERKTGAGGTYALIATLNAGQTGYSDSGLQPSTTYYYRIKAYNTGGESAYSTEASATTQAPVTSNNAAFVSQSVPAAMTPGQTLSVSVVMRNNGTTTWTPGSYYLGSQNPPGNTRWGTNRVNLALTVTPNAQVTFTFNISAPTTPGSYDFQWQMANSGGSFGSLTTNAVISVSARKTLFDFDADTQADITVYRPSNGSWFTIKTSNGQVSSTLWGSPGDIVVPADYDGDGKTDVAIYRPSNGNWWIINSSTGQTRGQQWGTAGDVPVPADYDGDGKADIAIFRPSNGTWWIINSSTGQVRNQQWAVSGDKPVPADYDGDGRADIAVYRPSNGSWLIINSSDSQATVQPWGSPGDIAVPADYDGDGRTDVAIFRPSNASWWIINSSTGQARVQQWGLNGDKPSPADYDGDGKADIAVFRPSNQEWWIIKSTNGQVKYQQWGIAGDISVPSVYTK